jgi:hypothetical protein
MESDNNKWSDMIVLGVVVVVLVLDDERWEQSGWDELEQGGCWEDDPNRETKHFFLAPPPMARTAASDEKSPSAAL